MNKQILYTTPVTGYIDDRVKEIMNKYDLKRSAVVRTLIEEGLKVYDKQVE